MLSHKKYLLNIQISMDLRKPWFIEVGDVFSSTRSQVTLIRMSTPKSTRRSTVLSDQRKPMHLRIKNLINHKIPGYNDMHAITRDGTCFQNSPMGTDSWLAPGRLYQWLCRNSLRLCKDQWNWLKMLCQQVTDMERSLPRFSALHPVMATLSPATAKFYETSTKHQKRSQRNTQILEMQSFSMTVICLA